MSCQMVSDAFRTLLIVCIIRTNLFFLRNYPDHHTKVEVLTFLGVVRSVQNTVDPLRLQISGYFCSRVWELERSRFRINRGSKRYWGMVDSQHYMAVAETPVIIDGPNSGPPCNISVKQTNPYPYIKNPIC